MGLFNVTSCTNTLFLLLKKSKMQIIQWMLKERPEAGFDMRYKSTTKNRDFKIFVQQEYILECD